MSLDELQRIKKWHVRHQDDHPVECHLWDAVLTLWLAGWVGLIPVFAFSAYWAAPLCALAAFAPSLYVTWRLRAHRGRCEETKRCERRYEHPPCDWERIGHLVVPFRCVCRPPNDMNISSRSGSVAPSEPVWSDHPCARPCPLGLNERIRPVPKLGPKLRPAPEGGDS